MLITPSLVVNFCFSLAHENRDLKADLQRIRSESEAASTKVSRDQKDYEAKIDELAARLTSSLRANRLLSAKVNAQKQKRKAKKAAVQARLERELFVPLDSPNTKASVGK